METIVPELAGINSHLDNINRALSNPVNQFGLIIGLGLSFMTSVLAAFSALQSKKAAEEMTKIRMSLTPKVENSGPTK